MRTTAHLTSSRPGYRSARHLAAGVMSSFAVLALLSGCGMAVDAPEKGAETPPEVAAVSESSEAEPGVAESKDSDDSQSSPAATAPTESASPTATSDPAPEPEPETVTPQSFSGTGSEVVILEPLGDAVFYAHVTHDGSSNVALWSVDENGQDIDLLVNEIGGYEGEVALNFDDDPAALRIEADGDWSIELVHLSEAPRWDGASTYEDAGDSVVIVDGVADGLTPVTLTHAGESNFAIWAWGENGTDLIVNDIGSYDGTTLLPDGSLVLQVNADGTWTLTKN